MKLAISPRLKHTLEILGQDGIEVELDLGLNEPVVLTDGNLEYEN